VKNITGCILAILLNGQENTSTFAYDVIVSKDSSRTKRTLIIHLWKFLNITEL